MKHGKKLILETDPAQYTQTIGIISDTHGMVDSGLFQVFKNVSLIIHAGDIGEGIIDELESIAPVVAVQGNMDRFLKERKLKETEIVEVAQKILLVTHMLGYPKRISEHLKTLIRDVKPHVVIFGHSHSPVNQIHDGVLYLNPGSAGPSRFAFKRSVALLHLAPDNVSATIIPLD